MIFLVKFWKVTVLQVNWLVSQECSWELSNLLYLYPSKISNLRRGFFFQFAFVQSEREELKLNVSKHFPNLAEAALAMCKMYSIFSWWNLTSSPSLFLGGIGWSVPIIINQSTWLVTLNSWQNFEFQKLITESCLVSFNKKVRVNFDIMHKHYWRDVSIKFKPTENIEILPGKPGNVINIFQ